MAIFVLANVIENIDVFDKPQFTKRIGVFFHNMKERHFH